MLMLPLAVPMTTQLGKKTGEGFHADAATVISHDTLLWRADKGAVKDHDQQPCWHQQQHHIGCMYRTPEQPGTILALSLN